MTTAEFTIRLMESGDIPDVAALEAIVFSDPWPETAFHEALESRNAYNTVAIDRSGVLSGYFCAQVIADELQVHNVAVAPACRRIGLGCLLLEKAEAHARAKGAVCSVLEVRITNAPALVMYGRLGYRRIGRRRRYYRQPVCDALVLFKFLEDTEEFPVSVTETIGWSGFVKPKPG